MGDLGLNVRGRGFYFSESAAKVTDPKMQGDRIRVLFPLICARVSRNTICGKTALRESSV